MRRAMFVACCILCLAAICAAGESLAGPAGATVEGVVLRAGTDEPVTAARVTLIALKPPASSHIWIDWIGAEYLSQARPRSSSAAATAGPSRLLNTLDSNTIGRTEISVTTGVDGRFAFREIAPGPYRLAFAADGYVPYEFGGKMVWGTGKTLTLEAAQTAGDFAVRMTPAGNLEGRLHEAGGGPIARIPVYLWRYVYEADGRRQADIAAAVLTDDYGAFRIFWITPGRYYLAAGGPLSRFSGLWPAPEWRASVHYPAAADSDGAEAIEIRPGSERTIAWALPAAQSLRIRARLTDSRTGKPPAAPVITVHARDTVSWIDREMTEIRGGPQDDEIDENQVQYDAATGMIEVSDLAGGSYEIRIAEIENGGYKPGRITEVVRLRDANAEGIVLDMAQTKLSALPPIRGRIKTAAGAFLAGQRLTVSLHPADDAPREFLIDTNDVFFIPVNPGNDVPVSIVNGDEYRVSVTGLPEGWYLHEAKLSGTDVLTRAAHFSASMELELTLSPRAGRVEGLVKDVAGKLVPGIQAVLVPERMRNRADLYRTAETDRNGRFTISNLPPGDYAVYAWEFIEPYSHFDPDILGRFERKGAPAQVTESSSQTVDVTLIPAGVDR